jgi:hypothetical protein
MGGETKNEFQGRFQQKQEKHPRIFDPRHFSHRDALIDRGRLRADEQHHDNDLYGKSDEHGVATKLFRLF